MKLGFLQLSPEERGLYIEQAAAERDISPIIIEKDFWVCWLLGILFESRFSTSLVFKGGTSLSKVFNAIDRFSEDIDLSLSPEFLELPPPGSSRNQSNKWMEQAEDSCAAAVERVIAPALENAVRQLLGAPESSWFEYRLSDTTHSPELLFHYPTEQPAGFGYLNRSVKLEFGSLTDQQPTGHHQITPWIAETFPKAFPDWRCDVVALELERTFWEKATILHAEYHRPIEKPTPDRFSRHYADTAALAKHSITDIAIGLDDLREHVVAWKGQFFGSGWANYANAKPGSFRLVPPESRISALRRDYQSMRDMYLSQPPTFDEVMSTLSELERRINQSA